MRIRALAVTVIVAAVALSGCSARGATSTSTTEAVASISLGDVVGMTGDKAQDSLETAGLEVDFDADSGVVILARNWVVLAQDPPAGTTVPAGSTITLSVTKAKEDAETPDPVASVAPAAPAAPLDPNAYAVATDREFGIMMKTPDDHFGERIVAYGEVVQFDAATGRCQFRANTAETQKEYSYEYSQNTMLFAGDGESVCPVLDNTVQNDIVKMYVTIMGSYSYATQIGGETTVPLFQVDGIELLPALEY